MYSYFEDDCIVLYTGLFISTAFELSKLNVLFDSMKTMKMGCYNLYYYYYFVIIYYYFYY